MSIFGRFIKTITRQIDAGDDRHLSIKIGRGWIGLHPLHGRIHCEVGWHLARETSMVARYDWEPPSHEYK
jgi:hypothetical protein